MTYSLIVVSLLLSPADAIGPERVSIQKLLSPQVTSYQQRLVALEGVTQVSFKYFLQPLVQEKRVVFSMEELPLFWRMKRAR
jgi:capsular polysaccharide biosynthesis protein